MGRRRWWGAGCLAVAAALVVVQPWVLAGDRPGAALAIAGRLAVKMLLAVALGLCIWSAARAAAGPGAERRLAQPGDLAWRHVALVAVAGAALLTVATQRSASRLVVTLLCYGLSLLPALWFAGARGGPRAAAWAAAALAIFTLVPTNLDLRRLPHPLMSPSLDPDQRWRTGWQGEAWVLRHEAVLPALSGSPPPDWRLTIPLAAPYEGHAPVTLEVNGQNVGRTRERSDALEFIIPGQIAATGHLVLDLHEAPVDPRVQLIASRFASASAGPHASSYFDGVRWWSGAFDESSGGPRPGIYLLRLDPAT